MTIGGLADNEDFLLYMSFSHDRLNIVAWWRSLSFL